MTGAQIVLGMIGCGWAASEIVRASAELPSLRIASVFDTDAGRATALAQKAGATRVLSVDTMLADSAVTTVYVGVPHALIAPIVERALTAGKHVLAEKPLALDPNTALRLGRLAAANRLKLAVFFELRRSGTVTLAKQLVDAGEVGEPKLIRLRTIIDKRSDYWGSPGAPNWRASRGLSGGGVLLMNTIHQLDTLRYVTGLEFTSAQGEVATFRAAAEVEDAGSAVLRLSNGGIVNIVASGHSPGASDEETIEIDGTTGRLDLPDPFGIAPLRLYRMHSKSWEDLAVARPDSHLHMLQSYVEAIREDSEVPAGANDAAAAVAAVNAIYRSATEGRRIDIG